jgi:hypothetical protein
MVDANKAATHRQDRILRRGEEILRSPFDLLTFQT